MASHAPQENPTRIEPTTNPTTNDTTTQEHDTTSTAEQEALLVNSCEQGNYEIVRSLLVEHGVNPHTRSPNGLPLIHLSANAGHTRIVQLLLNLGADPNSCDSANFTPLHYSSYHGKLDVVQLLIERQGTVDAVGANGSSALHLASAGDHHTVAQELIDHGAEVNRKNARNLRPIDLARSDAMKRLLENADQPRSIQITIQHFSNKKKTVIKHQITIDYKATVLELKSLIHKQLSINIDQQQLSFERTSTLSSSTSTSTSSSSKTTTSVSSSSSNTNQRTILHDSQKLCAVGIRDQSVILLDKTSSPTALLKQARTEIQELTNQLQQATMQQQAALSRLSTIQSYNQTLEQQHEKYQSELIQAREELDNQQTQLKQVTQQLQSQQHHVLDLETQLKQARELVIDERQVNRQDKSQLQEQLVEREIKVKELEVEVEQLTLDNKQLTQQYQEACDTIQHTKELEKTVVKLGKQLSKLKIKFQQEKEEYEKRADLRVERAVERAIQNTEKRVKLELGIQNTQPISTLSTIGTTTTTTAVTSTDEGESLEIRYRQVYTQYQQLQDTYQTTTTELEQIRNKYKELESKYTLVEQHKSLVEQEVVQLQYKTRELAHEVEVERERADKYFTQAEELQQQLQYNTTISSTTTSDSSITISSVVPSSTQSDHSMQRAIEFLYNRLLETQFMSTRCKFTNAFQFIKSLGTGQYAVVLQAKCVAPEFPFPDRYYAIKASLSFDQDPTLTRGSFSTEYNELVKLPPHPNIVQYICEFYDEVTDEVRKHLPEYAKEQSCVISRISAPRNRKTQYYVLEHLTLSLHEYLTTYYPSPQVVPIEVVSTIISQVAVALQHLASHRVVHRDIKLENIMIETDTQDPRKIVRCVLTDFGSSCTVNEEFTSTYSISELGYVISHPIGNKIHISPEIHTTIGQGIKSRTNVEIDYRNQYEFELGVLSYEVIIGVGPLENYPTQYTNKTTGEVKYEDTEILEIPEQYLDRDKAEILKRAVSWKRENRPTLEEIFNTFNIRKEVEFPTAPVPNNRRAIRDAPGE